MPKLIYLVAELRAIIGLGSQQFVELLRDQSSNVRYTTISTLSKFAEDGRS